MNDSADSVAKAKAQATCYEGGLFSRCVARTPHYSYDEGANPGNLQRSAAPTSKMAIRGFRRRGTPGRTARLCKARLLQSAEALLGSLPATFPPDIRTPISGMQQIPRLPTNAITERMAESLSSEQSYRHVSRSVTSRFADHLNANNAHI
jgi:hypothetical protein